MMQPLMPPITKNLLILNAILFFIPMLLPELSDWIEINLSAFYPESVYFKSWQIITHMFMHGNFSHFFFNMFALWMFGSTVENALREKRFLILYFAAGLGSFALFNLVNFLKVHGYMAADVAHIQRIMGTPMVGASGAIYGLLVAFGVWFPNHKLMLIFLPVPVKAKYFIPVMLAIEFYLGLADYAWNPIAHFAHLGGALIGYLLARHWKKNQYRKN